MNIDTNTLMVIGSILFSAVIIDGILLGIIFVTRRKVAQAASWPSTMGTVAFSSIEWRRGSKGGCGGISRRPLHVSSDGANA